MTRPSVNLASRPIERVRQARSVVGRVALGLAIVTLLQAAAFVWLGRAPAEQQVQVQTVDPATLASWQQEVVRLTEVADVQRARAAVTSVDMANQLIAWRTIPWDAIFGDLEAVLPDRAKLESVQPGIEPGDEVRISIVAAARDTGPLQDLLIALEQHPSFEQVYPQQETTGLDGLQRINLQALYTPAVAPGVAR